MNTDHRTRFIQSPHFCVILLSLLFFTGSLFAAVDEAEPSGLSELSAQEQVDQKTGDFADIFVKLRQSQDFLRLSKKHGLDDPAAWDTLRRRFVLNIAELQGRLSDAKSMMATQDARSGLSDTVISAEKTRAKGRRLYADLSRQIEEMRQMLRLMDEAEAVLEEVGSNHALTGVITIENKAGQGFAGQVLLINGNDLIVKRENVGYFRIPANLLSDGTKLKIMEEVFSLWKELPRITADFEFGGELVAYGDSRLFFKQGEKEGVVSTSRPEDASLFVSHAAQLESVREALSNSERKEREALEMEVQQLEKAISLNQSRVEAIQWYESRLGIEVPESDTIELEVEVEVDAEENANQPEAEIRRGRDA